MAINPTYGSNIRAAEADPNGPVGRTRGDVRDLQAEPAAPVREPSAGSTALVPPFLSTPRRTPLADVDTSMTEVGPDT